MLMDVNRVMLPIGFHVHAKIDGDTAEIMHPEPLIHLVLDLPNQACNRNDEKIIDLQNDRGKNFVLMRIVKQDQSSIET
jgi:hypothetical protein